MRIIGLAAAFALLASPAFAQTLPEQYDSVRQAFTSGQDRDTLMGGGYYSAIARALEGSWIDMSAFEPGGAMVFEDFVARTCEMMPIAVSAPAPYTLRMTLVSSNGNVTTDYIYVGGTSFVGQTDAREHLTRLGLIERMDRSPQAALFAMAAANGPVDLYRPFADTFVITAQRAPARILIRCSATTPAVADAGGSDDPALRDAIGRAVDIQFGEGADPLKKQAFIDCALPVFSPLSAEDRKIVIETDFNPPSPDRERIEAAYPQVAAGAMACAEAADSGELP